MQKAAIHPSQCAKLPTKEGEAKAQAEALKEGSVTAQQFGRML